MAIQKHTKIFTVFSFLRLKSADIFWYQWVYPTIIFILIYFGHLFVGQDVIVFNADNFVSGINALMGVLVGFYIASLAAVSSFTNENLDKIMKGRAPKITIILQGKPIEETLTRRRFLAILFGYCAILSILLYVFGIVQSNTQIEVPEIFWVQVCYAIGKQMAWAGYIWMVSSLLVVTLLGLHYLVERMHRA